MTLRPISVCAAALAVALPVAAADLQIGRWSGQYVCPQGPTALALDVWREGSEDLYLTGRFAFTAPDGTSGAYIVDVQVNGDQVRLVPRGWESRPYGYDMTGAVMRLNGDAMTGRLDDARCSTISVAYSGADTTTADQDTGGSDAASSSGGWQEPDYMARAREERKAQNRANCERASKGASVQCLPDDQVY